MTWTTHAGPAPRAGRTRARAPRAALLVGLLAATACGGAGTASGPFSGSFVTSHLSYPSQRESYAADVDGDGLADNALGTLSGAMGGAQTLERNMNAYLREGSGLLLLRFDATSLADDPAAAVQVLHADPQAEPDLDGGGTFTSVETPTTLTGAIRNGRFVSDLPTQATPSLALTVRLFAGTPPVSLVIHGPRIAFDASASGLLAGRIDGALDPVEAEPAVSAALAAYGTSILAVDPGNLLSNYDRAYECAADATNLDGTPAASEDGKLAPCEVRGQVMAWLTPDVRVFDGEMRWSPVAGAAPEDRNGTSLGFGFVAVPARF